MFALWILASEVKRAVLYLEGGETNKPDNPLVETDKKHCGIKQGQFANGRFASSAETSEQSNFKLVKNNKQTYKKPFQYVTTKFISISNSDYKTKSSSTGLNQSLEENTLLTTPKSLVLSECNVLALSRDTQDFNHFKPIKSLNRDSYSDACFSDLDSAFSDDFETSEEFDYPTVSPRRRTTSLVSKQDIFLVKPRHTFDLSNNQERTCDDISSVNESNKLGETTIKPKSLECRRNSYSSTLSLTLTPDHKTRPVERKKSLLHSAVKSELFTTLQSPQTTSLSGPIYTQTETHMPEYGSILLDKQTEVPVDSIPDSLGSTRKCGKKLCNCEYCTQCRTERTRRMHHNGHI